MVASRQVNLIKQGNKRLNRIVSLASTIMRAFDEDSDGGACGVVWCGAAGTTSAATAQAILIAEGLDGVP